MDQQLHGDIKLHPHRILSQEITQLYLRVLQLTVIQIQLLHLHLDHVQDQVVLKLPL